MPWRTSIFDYARVLDAARESFLVTDADVENPTIVWVSPTFARLTGYGCDEVLGLTPRILQGPRTDRAVTKRLRACLRDGREFEGETWNYRKNGEVFLMHWYVVPLRDASGAVTHFLGVQRDVTAERVRAREDQQLSSSLVPHDVAVVALDRQLRIAVSNPAADAIVGDSAIGRPFFETPLAPADGAARDDLMRAIVTARSHTVETTLESPNGAARILSLATSPLSRAGDTLRASIVLTDVTDSRRIERIAANVSLSDNIGHAFAGIRHELGNPVNSLKSALTFVRSQLGTMPEAQLGQYLDAMVAQCDRMDYLLRSLRTFSALDCVDIDSIDVQKFVERFERSATEVIVRKGIRFERTIDPRCTHVYADDRALYQVLLNLVTNAVDACSAAAEPSIGLYVTRAGNDVVFEVRDNGVGIPPQDLEKLFRPFFTTKATGTGLGLAMSERLVTRMFGSLGVASLEGEGTSFSVTLRAEPPTTNARRHAVAPSWHP